MLSASVQKNQPIHTNPVMMLWRIIVMFVFAMSGAYGMSLTLFYIARGFIGESINFIGLLNNIIHLMLFPALVLFPLALIFRRWVVSVMLVIPFITVIQNNAPLFIGSVHAAPSDTTEISVMTYNLLARHGDFDPSIDIIREADADIVALQEVGYAAEQRVLDELANEYPYIALHGMTYPTQGQGILSRYPIVEDEYIPSYLGHQRTILDVNGTQVAVYNLHPAHPGMTNMDVSVRGNDIDLVLPRAIEDARTMPVLFVGDFNMTPNTWDYVRITETFTDTYKEAGFGLGYTFPNEQAGFPYRYLPPLARIDYIFHDDDWFALEAWVASDSGGSDHRPVVARLALMP